MMENNHENSPESFAIRQARDTNNQTQKQMLSSVSDELNSPKTCITYFKI